MKLNICILCLIFDYLLVPSASLLFHIIWYANRQFLKTWLPAYSLMHHYWRLMSLNSRFAILWVLGSWSLAFLWSNTQEGNLLTSWIIFNRLLYHWSVNICVLHWLGRTLYSINELSILFTIFLSLKWRFCRRNLNWRLKSCSYIKILRTLNIWQLQCLFNPFFLFVAWLIAEFVSLVELNTLIRIRFIILDIKISLSFLELLVAKQIVIFFRIILRSISLSSVLLIINLWIFSLPVHRFESTMQVPGFYLIVLWIIFVTMRIVAIKEFLKSLEMQVYIKVCGILGGLRTSCWGRMVVIEGFRLNIHGTLASDATSWLKTIHTLVKSGRRKR